MLVKKYFELMLFIVLPLSVTISCSTIKVNKLTYKNSYTLVNSKIMVDGYYSFKEYYKNKYDSIMNVIIFFKNGYLYKNSYISEFVFKKYISENIEKDKIGWGCYKTVGDTIKIQYFTAAGGSIWDVIEKNGIIKDSGNINFFTTIYNNKRTIDSSKYIFYPMLINSEGKNWLQKEK